MCYRKEEKTVINNLSFHIKNLGKEQIKPKTDRRKEIKTRAEISKIENIKIIEKNQLKKELVL